VQCEHADPRQAGCGCHRASHGIGDIVKLEIEEDIGAKARKLFNGLRAFGCEELFADLEKASYASKLPRQGAGRPQAVHIEGND
jgi:hypothetical protein